MHERSTDIAIVDERFVLERLEHGGIGEPRLPLVGCRPSSGLLVEVLLCHGAEVLRGRIPDASFLEHATIVNVPQANPPRSCSGWAWTGRKPPMAAAQNTIASAYAVSGKPAGLLSVPSWAPQPRSRTEGGRWRLTLRRAALVPLSGVGASWASGLLRHP